MSGTLAQHSMHASLCEMIRVPIEIEDKEKFAIEKSHRQHALKYLEKYPKAIISFDDNKVVERPYFNKKEWVTPHAFDVPHDYTWFIVDTTMYIQF
jgi:hypothetical protein